MSGILLISGTRHDLTGENWHTVHQTICSAGPSFIIHGACGAGFGTFRDNDLRGVDRIAHSIAISNKASVLPVPANWQKYGPGAGPRRNLAMVRIAAELQDLDHDVRVLAFPMGGSKGTRHLIASAQSYRLKVHVFELQC